MSPTCGAFRTALRGTPLTLRLNTTFESVPAGGDFVLNFVVVNPALINATFEAPIVRVHDERYAFKLSTSVPPELQRILDGDIVVKRIDITTGATRVIDGRRRGYYEAGSCPRSGGYAIHGEFEFNQGMRCGGGSDSGVLRRYRHAQQTRSVFRRLVVAWHLLT